MTFDCEQKSEFLKAKYASKYCMISSMDTDRIKKKIEDNAGKGKRFGFISVTHISKMLSSLYSMAKSINSYCTIPLIRRLAKAMATRI
jgi:hypothetical protein